MSSLPQIARLQIARFPEVTALVVTDRVGSLLEATGEIDGEALGAVHMVTAQGLARCGNALGLGPLHRITIASPRHPCLIAVDGDDDVLGVYIDPSKPLGAFEKKLEAALRR